MEENSNIQATYFFKLYITGASPNSIKAINNTRNFCEKHLKGRYQLEIIDLYQQPMIAKSEQIIAIPLLVKSLPLPAKKLIGNMTDTNKMLRSLDLEYTE